MNVAVKEPFRQQGIARALNEECARKFGDKILFLSTEKDSVDEEIYKKLEFNTVEIGNCYVERS
jgi:ribosomal protein S18 acetylase RimI-like enzyme